MSCSGSGGEEGGPQRDRQPQALDEDAPGADREHDAVDQHCLPVELATGQARDADQQRQRDRHAEPWQQEPEEHDRAEDRQDQPPSLNEQTENNANDPDDHRDEVMGHTASTLIIRRLGDARDRLWLLHGSPGWGGSK